MIWTHLWHELSKVDILYMLPTQPYVDRLRNARICGRIHLKYDGTRWCREGKWKGNWRMEWVASTLHSTSEHGVSTITTADAHTSAASSRLNWRPRRFKWTHPYRRKTKSGICSCAITFQLASKPLQHRNFLTAEWNTSRCWETQSIRHVA